MDLLRSQVEEFSLAEGGGLSLSGQGVSPYLLPEDHGPVALLLEAYEEATRKEARTYWSRWPTPARGLGPVPLFGPLARQSSFLAGQANESLGVDELLMAARVYVVAYLKLCDASGRP